MDFKTDFIEGIGGEGDMPVFKPADFADGLKGSVHEKKGRGFYLPGVTVRPDDPAGLSDCLFHVSSFASFG